jgi:hypothetical protein
VAPGAEIGGECLALRIEDVEDRDPGAFLCHSLDASAPYAYGASGHDGRFS